MIEYGEWKDLPTVPEMVERERNAIDWDVFYAECAATKKGNRVSETRWDYLYKTYMRYSERWAAVRKGMRELHPICKCGAPADNVHHINYSNLFFDYVGDPNLECICHNCHAAYHSGF